MELTLDLLRKLCAEGKVKWTMHAVKRIRERGIRSLEVTDCILQGKVIENYYDDNPFPSCLICSLEREPLHVVVSTDGEFIYFITAYRPSPEEWKNNFTCRKENL